MDISRGILDMLLYITRGTQHAAASHSHGYLQLLLHKLLCEEKLGRDLVSFSYHLHLGVGSGNETSILGVHLLFVHTCW